MFPLQVAVPTRFAPVVTWLLIAANCGVFVFELSLSPGQLEWLVVRYGLVPARELAGGPTPGIADYLPFFTNMFLHAGWLHLILNMWTLWLFGPIVEDRLGPARYLAFYLLCGLTASVVHAMVNPLSAMPALGASGAIAGVIGCAISLFPMARLVIMIPILFFPLFFEVPAILFAGVWFMLQLMQGTADQLAPGDTGGVAWWAHVGGFVAGVALTPVLLQPQPRYRAFFADEGILGFNQWGR